MAASSTSPSSSAFIGILGVGSHAPEQVLTNDDLAKRMDTDDEWIRTRTGIRERRIARPDESTSDLAVAAARAALADAGIEASQVGLIVVATCTPDMLMPSVAALVQQALGASKAAAFDLNAACAGFAYALEVGTQLSRTLNYGYTLVIGAEVMSRAVDWEDRATAVLFGDGAGAVILGPVDGNGIYGSALHADGSGMPHLYIPGGGFRSGEKQGDDKRAMIMNGREVYRFAVRVMGQSALEALARYDISTERVALFVPHQANVRIIESAAKHMDLGMDRVFVNVDKYGNTSSASVPLALDEAYRSGRLKKGDIVVTVGFGAGLTWGANVIEWSKDAPPR